MLSLILHVRYDCKSWYWMLCTEMDLYSQPFSNKCACHSWRTTSLLRNVNFGRHILGKIDSSEVCTRNSIFTIPFPLRSHTKICGESEAVTFTALPWSGWSKGVAEFPQYENMHLIGQFRMHLGYCSLGYRWQMTSEANSLSCSTALESLISAGWIMGYYAVRGSSIGDPSESMLCNKHITIVTRWPKTFEQAPDATTEEQLLSIIKDCSLKLHMENDWFYSLY